MSGCWQGATRVTLGYATLLHLNGGIRANKSPKSKAETIA